MLASALYACRTRVKTRNCYSKHICDRYRDRLVKTSRRMSTETTWNRNDYKSALEALNSLQSNAAAIAAWKKRARSANSPQELHEEMIHGIESLHVNLDWLSPRSIHVAGTKGKGSVSAMAESIVRHHGFKTGLFTSPHLVTVRERIKINGKAISEEQFVKYFWMCWDLLSATRCEKWPSMPGWFRFLTLMAFKVFQEEQVDCAVVEVGIGGRSDSTNVLTFPAACGITLLDYDHTEVLGDTLPLIAAEKAGIFKPGVPAVTVPQTSDALNTLYERAIATKAPLWIAESTIEAFTGSSTSPALSAEAIGFRAEFQKTNALLAIALSELWLSKWSPSTHAHALPPFPIASDAQPIPPRYPPHPVDAATIEGLRHYHWPGRAQIHQSPGSSLCYYLDGAHTMESMKACISWFVSNTTSGDSSVSHVVLFNCNKPRDPRVLLEPIATAIANGRMTVDFIYFTMSQVSLEYRKDPSNDISYSQHTQNTWQHEMAGMWAEMVAAHQSGRGSDEDFFDEFATTPIPTATPQNAKPIVWPTVKVVSNINEALNDVNNWANSIELGPSRVNVLATGSLYLVGALLEFLNYPTDQ